MNGVHGDELSKQLLEFQPLFVRQAYRWKRTQVSLHIPSHKAMLEEANLSEEGGKWIYHRSTKMGKGSDI